MIATAELLLPVMLDYTVPLYIRDLRAAGGPCDRDWETARAGGGLLAHGGDNLLFTSQKKGETASLFNSLAFALAVMAFAPCGVRFAGRHWVVEPCPECEKEAPE